MKQFTFVNNKHKIAASALLTHLSMVLRVLYSTNIWTKMKSALTITAKKLVKTEINSTLLSVLTHITS